MKHALPALSLALLAAPAHAHETRLDHIHPHTDWTALIALGAIIAIGVLALVMRRTAAIRKDKTHDPR